MALCNGALLRVSHQNSSICFESGNSVNTLQTLKSYGYFHMGQLCSISVRLDITLYKPYICMFICSQCFAAIDAAKSAAVVQPQVSIFSQSNFYPKYFYSLYPEMP